MHVESLAHSTTFAGESAHTSHEYYHLGRVRSGSAETVLSAMSFFASSIMLAKGLKRDELFEKYDLKLWSYDDNLARFTLSILPSAAALGVLYVAHRLLSSLHQGLAL